jgi:hypothetical protein
MASYRSGGSSFGRAPNTSPTGLVDVNKTWTPQQKMGMAGRGTQPSDARMPMGFGMGANPAAQQAYNATLPGGKAQAFDRMREEQRVSSLYGQGTTPDDLLAQNKQTQLSNFGAPVDMNSLPMGEYGRVGNPIMGGAEAYAQRTQQGMMNPPLTLNGMQRLMQPQQSEMNPMSSLANKLGGQNPLMNRLLQ